MNKYISKFFSEKVQFLRPIGPMAVLTSGLGLSRSTEPTGQAIMYRKFGAFESCMFNLKMVVTTSLNDRRMDGTSPIRDNLIPYSLNDFVSVQPMMKPTS